MLPAWWVNLVNSIVSVTLMMVALFWVKVVTVFSPQSALHLAVEGGSQVVVEELCRRAARTGLPNARGDTAVHLAIRWPKPFNSPPAPKKDRTLTW